MLIVQESSGLYNAVQYDGTNGAEVVAALRATDVRSFAGVLTFRSFIMRTGGLLTSAHRFQMPLGHWIVWVDGVNPYVVGGPMTQSEFDDQYQICDCSATNGAILSLQVAVAAIVAELNAFDAINITAGTLPYQRLGGTIAEADTVVFNRATLADPGSAADTWRFAYNGVRTIYANEYNLLRVRGVPDDQVPARFMSNAARDGLSTPIMQASLSNASSHLFQVLGNGDIQAAGGLSMLPTAPVAVTFNGAAGTANAVTISDGSASGTPYPVTTTYNAADNRVYLDGSVANPTGVSIPGGTILFTITAAHRPAFWAQFAGRTSTVLATRITVKPGGEVVLDQALAAGATLSFDGRNWRKA